MSQPVLQLFNVKSVSESLEVTPQAVRKAISIGRLKAQWIGNQWVIFLEDLCEYAKENYDMPDKEVAELREALEEYHQTLGKNGKYE